MLINITIGKKTKKKRQNILNQLDGQKKSPGWLVVGFYHWLVIYR